MLIKMKTDSASPDGVKVIGKEYEVDSDVGEALVKGGYAEAVAVTGEGAEVPEGEFSEPEAPSEPEPEEKAPKKGK